MQIVPPETKMEWTVYKELKTNEYWNQTVEKKCISTNKIETLYKFSEGEKSIIFDIFRQIDKMIHPSYDNINLQYYLITINKECNHSNSTLNSAIKKIVKQIFNIDI